MSIQLPRLPQGFSPAEMQVWWQTVVEAIEAQEATQDEILTALATAVRDILAAQAAAEAAQLAADKAAADAATAQAEADAAALAAATAQTEAESKQDASAVLGDLAALEPGAGIIERTSNGTFVQRAVGVAAPTSVITRSDGDTRFAPVSHTHAIADVTGLQTALDGKFDKTGGTLTGPVTINASASSTILGGVLVKTAAANSGFSLTSTTITGNISAVNADSTAYAIMQVNGLTRVRISVASTGFTTTNVIDFTPTAINALMPIQRNGVQVVNTRGAAVADAVAAVAAPTMAEFNALVTQFNTLLARLRSTTGHGLFT